MLGMPKIVRDTVREAAIAPDIETDILDGEAAALNQCVFEFSRLPDAERANVFVFLGSRYERSCSDESEAEEAKRYAPVPVAAMLVDPAVGAISECVGQLDPLDERARARVLRFLYLRYGGGRDA